MKNILTRRHLIHTGLACGLSMALPKAHSCQLTLGNFVLVHPWTRATAHDATTAAVSMTFEEVVADDRLIGASTPVAEGAEMGGEAESKVISFRIVKGQSSALSEQGTYLKLVGLKLPMEVGRSYPLNLLFEKAGPVQASLSVDYARFG